MRGGELRSKDPNPNKNLDASRPDGVRNKHLALIGVSAMQKVGWVRFCFRKADFAYF